MPDDPMQNTQPNDSNPPDKAANAEDDQLPPQPKPTGMLKPRGDKPKPMPPRQPSPNTTTLTSAWKLIFQIKEERVLLPIDNEILVGRSSDSGGTTIDFDLTPHGAYHYGVSRKHAIISLADGQLYIEDLGSTNGTRINGFQLTAHQKYRLRDTDEIEFARLRTSIRFRDPNTSDDE